MNIFVVGGKCVSISLHPSLTAGEAVLLVAKEANLQEFQVTTVILISGYYSDTNFRLLQ